MGRHVRCYELSEEGTRRYHELRAFIIKQMTGPFYTLNLKAKALKNGIPEGDLELLMVAFDDLYEEGIVRIDDIPPEMVGPTTFTWAFYVR